jgi:16S rRNA (adenine(1408)-N(1))-methyltransferase
VAIDVGTGDGRAVLEAAAREPTTLVLGIDANAASMAESSRRAARSARRGGFPNAAFAVAPAEAMPAVLAGISALVTVRFPWGSLLRGCLGGDPAVATGIGGLAAQGGTLELLLAPALRDGLEGIPTTTDGLVAVAAATFERFGLRLIEGRPARPDEVRMSGSTWARRLGVGRSDARRDARSGRSGLTVERDATLIRFERTAARRSEPAHR